MVQKNKKCYNTEPVCDKHRFVEEEVVSLRGELLCWYDRHARVLPWRNIARTEKNDDQRGYSVLVSEIMLQQTQVTTVIDYFNKWIKKWPSTKELAATDLESVNQAWSGLGYYSRGRRLWESSRQIEEQLGGHMPNTRDDLLKLPGVGKYSASAVASIAYGARVGVVDGNVLRVLSRLRGIGADIDSPKVVEHMWKLADEIVDPVRPGDFNQAMMELGATVCTPKGPSCSSCPVRKICLGKNLNVTSVADIEDSCFFCNKSNIDPTDGVLNYPRKVKKVASREESTLVIALSIKEESNHFLYAIQQRPKTGLLANLWELLTLPVQEGKLDSKQEYQMVQNYLEQRKVQFSEVKRMGSVSHVFSHINMSYIVYTATLNHLPDTEIFQFASIEDFLEKGTSTAMKKVVKFLQGTTSTGAAPLKRKSIATPDPKQRTMLSFFKKTKNEI